MADNAVSQAKMEVWDKAAKAFYTDFMPMIQKIQYNVSILNFFDDEKSQKYIIDQINREISAALRLLKQLKRFSELPKK